MGLMDNIKAKFNAVVEKHENVEELANLQIKEMKEAFQEAKSESASVIGSVRASEQELKKAKEKEEEITEKIKALAALSKDESQDEQIRNDALTRAKAYAEKLATAREDVEKATDALAERKQRAEEVKRKIAALEDKIEEAEKRKKDMISDLKNAEANIKINESLDISGSAAELSRLENKIQDKINKSYGYDELSGYNDQAGEADLLKKASTSSILDEFDL